MSTAPTTEQLLSDSNHNDNVALYGDRANAKKIFSHTLVGLAAAIKTITPFIARVEQDDEELKEKLAKEPRKIRDEFVGNQRKLTEGVKSLVAKARRASLRGTTILTKSDTKKLSAQDVEAFLNVAYRYCDFSLAIYDEFYPLILRQIELLFDVMPDYRNFAKVYNLTDFDLKGITPELDKMLDNVDPANELTEEEQADRVRTELAVEQINRNREAQKRVPHFVEEAAALSEEQRNERVEQLESESTQRELTVDEDAELVAIKFVNEHGTGVNYEEFVANAAKEEVVLEDENA